MKVRLPDFKLASAFYRYPSRTLFWSWIFNIFFGRINRVWTGRIDCSRKLSL